MYLFFYIWYLIFSYYFIISNYHKYSTSWYCLKCRVVLSLTKETLYGLKGHGMKIKFYCVSSWITASCPILLWKDSLCAQCFQCLWIVNYWLPPTLTFIWTVVVKVKLEDTKGVISVYKSMKDTQTNGQNKKVKEWSRKHYT